jgi:hypothetical protein
MAGARELGTRLINANVPQHIVQELLDHMSPAMTGVYARLHTKTVREHWERAVTVNAQGEIVQLSDGDPLSNAAWTRVSLGRAKQTLPNGCCGLPLVRDLRTRQSLPVLPHVPHHPGLPAPTPRAARPDTHDHRIRTSGRPRPHRIEEHQDPSQLRQDHRYL